MGGEEWWGEKKDGGNLKSWDGHRSAPSGQAKLTRFRYDSLRVDQSLLHVSSRSAYAFFQRLSATAWDERFLRLLACLGI